MTSTTLASVIRIFSGAAASRSAMPRSSCSLNSATRASSVPPARPPIRQPKTAARRNPAQFAPNALGVLIGLKLLPVAVFGVGDLEVLDRQALETSLRRERGHEVLLVAADDRDDHGPQFVGGDQPGTDEVCQRGVHAVDQRAHAELARLVAAHGQHHESAVGDQFASAECDELVPVLGRLPRARRAYLGVSAERRQTRGHRSAPAAGTASGSPTTTTPASRCPTAGSASRTTVRSPSRTPRHPGRR